jgi:hypothetical protein
MKKTQQTGKAKKRKWPAKWRRAAAQRIAGCAVKLATSLSSLVKAVSELWRLK